MNEEFLERLWEFAPMFVEATPHCAELGIRFIAVDVARATLSLPYNKNFIGDPKSRVLHGGAITTLLDQVSGLAAISAFSELKSVATLNLSIDYMRAAKPGENVIARAHCYKITRHVAFVRGSAHDGDETNPVATSQATFMVTNPKATNQDMAAMLSSRGSDK